MNTPVERLEAWIAALRSGKYEQTTGRLRGTYGYCCLGVACDLYDSTAWEKPQRTIGWHFGDEPAVLPSNVRRAYGIAVGDEMTLTESNDGGDSFAAIADYIESVILPSVREAQESSK